MSALSKIEAAGFRVFLKGEILGISPANNLTPSQREFLKLHKSEIITELQEQVEWLELPEPAPGALMVVCYTPARNAIEVEAKNPEHADFLMRMNHHQ